MAEQLTATVGEFGSYLDGLLARLDQGAGWCGVFWRRDPDGMRACREGHEVPPWDLVDALLRDLAAAYGTAPALAERERARVLHTAALTAYDARPGAHDTLTHRLHATLRARRHADDREAALAHRLAGAATESEAEYLQVELAWARDDRHRATARCAELRDRLSRLARPGSSAVRVPGQGVSPDGGRSPRAGSRSAGADSASGRMAGAAPAPGRMAGVDSASGRMAGAAPAPGRMAGADSASGRMAGADLASGHPADAHPATPPTAATGREATPSREATSPIEAAPNHEANSLSEATPTHQATPTPRKRRRGSARFAGLGDAPAAPLVLPGAPQATPDLRGARFAGAEAEETRDGERAHPVPDADDHRAVASLAVLRSTGRTGEAHILLAEAARWPALRFPLLAEALTGAGLDADWATLRWEAAALPPEQLVAAAAALESAGHAREGHRLLREGAARPPEETGAAVARLDAEGRHGAARALLDACVRARTPEDAARTATEDPDRLAPLLLEAARRVSEDYHRDLAHALRAAGITP
ncbi:hypothetical protein ACGFZR_02415 [Streptomyces sp. NPDC048241]|uniref:hypothetical protein n=1 Tax=Streptomyces sp. NPDC048241 TaxID=3365521 RepID=UPI00370FCC85